MTTQEEWEKEFESKWGESFAKDGFMTTDLGDGFRIDKDCVKSFIRNEIAKATSIKRAISPEHFLKIGEYDQNDAAIIAYDDLYNFRSQALEQGRAEGSRGDYGRKMYMRGMEAGKEEALDEVVKIIPNEAPEKGLWECRDEVERELISVSHGFNSCRLEVLTSLSNLRKVENK